MQEIAAAILAILANGSQQNKDAVIAAGAVPPLLATLTSDQPVLQGQAALALENLAAGSQPGQDVIVAAGAVPLLVAFLRSDEPAV